MAKPSKKSLKKCGGYLIPGIRKYKRRPCERCSRYKVGEPSLVESLAYNEQAGEYTCEHWV